MNSVDNPGIVLPRRGASFRAFSEEVDTASSKENAVNQELRAVDLIG
jgi:hypothetical protein